LRLRCRVPFGSFNVTLIYAWRVRYPSS
jgi:hypothetical protein